MSLVSGSLKAMFETLLWAFMQATLEHWSTLVVVAQRAISPRLGTWHGNKPPLG